MKIAARITIITATAALMAACTTAEIKPIPDSTAQSRQIALMPYNNQGMTVAGSSNWYYGEGAGIKAFPAEGGIIYVVPDDKKLAAEAENLGAGGLDNSISENMIADGEGRLGKQANTDKSGLKRFDAGEGASRYCSGKIGPNGVPEDMADADLLTRVHFYFNETDKMYKESADLLARILSEKPTANRIHIIGFTDDRGTDAINNPIAQGRADHVKQEISEKWPGLEITTEGRGTCPRFADNATEKGRALNRRAEVYTF